MKKRTFVLLVLMGLVALGGIRVRADNMASIAITPATGTVSLTPRWGIGGSLAGFHLMAQDLSLGGGANQFYSIKGTTIPDGGDILAFNRYIAGSGAATPHSDIGSKLTPNYYSALTSADPDIGYGSVNLYFIHHKTSGDYFTAIVPSSGTASAVTDLKPMSGPGGPATLGASGYFGLTFAASNLGYGLNMFYYLRTDAVTGFTRFGTLEPALLGTSADKFDLGVSGYNALAFTGTDVGYGTDKMYYLRLDSITGFSILGTLHPVTGRASDIANLGSVFSTLTFVPGDVGFGSGQFYTTGGINTTWQSISFAAIQDRLISAGSFTVTPSASSGLPVALTVVSGSVGSAAISGPVAGVFTVTPTAPGLITLQATQSGQVAPAFEFNMLRQSFTASGTATLAITTQPVSKSAVTGTTATLTVAASGTTALSYQWRKAGANITGNASATTATLTLANVQSGDGASYDVVVSNASGSIPSNAAILTVTTPAPIITNNPLTGAGTVGTTFSFSITASGSPTGYTASPLPAGLSIVAATGVISGTPTAAGTTAVLLGASNSAGTGNATLTITVAAAGVAPIITNNPLTAGGTVGTVFSFSITASGSPTGYTASPLPAGLSIVAGTGVISGTPTGSGATAVLLGASNATGTGNATLTITVAAAGVAPIITNNPLTAAGTVGTPFSFTITASGSPVSYSTGTLPAGLSLVAATGVITGTPTATGTTAVLLGASNTTGTGNATLAITVAAADVAPIISNNPLTAAGTVGTPFSFAITASGSPTSYAASPLPAGLSLVVATGVITGTPTATGTTAVLLGASNTTGTGNATLTITVGAAGVAPIISNNPLTAAGTVGTPFSFNITASGSPTSYAASPLPAGLSIVAATGVITGTPTTVGATTVLLGASNATGTGNATLTITVAPAGVAPIITNDPLAVPATIGRAFSFTITASGLPTSYAASPLPAGLSIVAETGAITGTPTTAGSTTVLLGATNGTGTGTTTLTITVEAFEGNHDPFIAVIKDQTIPEQTPWSLIVAGSDVDGGVLKYSLDSGAPTGAAINATTGVMNWTPTEAQGPGVYLLTARVADSSHYQFIRRFNVTVTEVNQAPALAVIADQSVKQGGSIHMVLQASDADIPANRLTFRLEGAVPAGASVNPVTGEFDWTPSNIQAGNTMLITVGVFDDGTPSMSATRSFRVTVNSGPNTAPFMASLLNRSVFVGETLLVVNGAGDGDLPPQTLTWSLGAGAPAGMTINPATGLLSWMPASAGTYNVTLVVTDDGSPRLAASKMFTVSVVQGANLPPTLDFIANQQMLEDGNSQIVSLTGITAGLGETQILTVSATAANLHLLTAPFVGYTSPNTGANLTYQPLANANGTTAITVTVSDDHGGRTIRIFDVTILAVNDAPTIQVIQDIVISASPGEVRVNLSGIASGAANEAQNLTVTASSDNPAMVPAPQVNYASPAASGELVLNPVNGQNGTAVITVTVKDDGGVANGGTDTTVLRFKVSRTDAPLFFQHTDGTLGRWMLRGEILTRADYLDPARTRDGNWDVVAVADFNNDLSPDLLLKERGGMMAVWFMDGVTLKSGAYLNPGSTGDDNWRVVAAADLNRDGQTDIVFQHADRTLAVWLMNGLSLVEARLLSPSDPGVGWGVVGAGDFNSDGQADLMFQHEAGGLAVWLMNGTQLSEPKWIDPATAPVSAGALQAVTDLDHDGNVDLVFQNSNVSMDVWFMNGTKLREVKSLNPSPTTAGWSIVGP